MERKIKDLWSVVTSKFSFLVRLPVFPLSITSYQTLPRNMPSHRAQPVPRYPEGYRTLPRNSMMRPDSICSMAGSVYDRALRPASTTSVTTADKRRSMRDDTMWQLYEWQQRQAFSRHSIAMPSGTQIKVFVYISIFIRCHVCKLALIILSPTTWDWVRAGISEHPEHWMWLCESVLLQIGPSGQLCYYNTK